MPCPRSCFLPGERLGTSGSWSECVPFFANSNSKEVSQAWECQAWTNGFRTFGFHLGHIRQKGKGRSGDRSFGGKFLMPASRIICQIGSPVQRTSIWNDFSSPLAGDVPTSSHLDFRLVVRLIELEVRSFVEAKDSFNRSHGTRPSKPKSLAKLARKGGAKVGAGGRGVCGRRSLEAAWQLGTRAPPSWGGELFQEWLAELEKGASCSSHESKRI